jgi:hypothetical protein
LLLPGSTWSWVSEMKRLKAIPAKDFADRLIAQLAGEFDPTFEAVKTQRLLTSSRNRDYVAEVCHRITTRANSMPCSGKRRSMLKRHCEASLFFQEIFSDIEEKGRALSIWKANFRDLASEAISALEDTFTKNVLSNRSQFESNAPFSKVFQAGEAESRYIRDCIDWTIMILNEARSLANKSGTVKLTREEIHRAYEFTRLVERAELIWSHYSFNGIEAYVKDQEISLDEVPMARERNRMINYARSYNSDVAENIGFNQRFTKARRECAEKLSESEEMSLEAFLSSQSGLDLAAALEPPSVEMRKLLYERLDYLIDLDENFKLPSGKFSYRELTDGWVSLHKFSYLLQVWCTQGIRESGDATRPAVAADLLASFLMTDLGISVQKARSIMRQFTSTAHGRIDLFFKPLLDIGEGNLVISSAAIQMSRFDRNLLHILATEVSLDVSAKGKRPLSILVRQLDRAGFRHCENVPVKDGPKLVTDIDVMAAKDGVLFLLQSKVLAESDNSYEEWKNMQSLFLAASQMNESLRCLRPAVEKRRAQLGIPRSYRVVPILITNVWDFTGERVGGFVVTDFSYMGNVLSGAEARVKTLGEKGTLGAFKFIEGPYPSASELDRLLREPFHGMFLKAESEYRRDRISFGSKIASVSVRVVERLGFEKERTEDTPLQSPNVGGS